MIKTFKYWKEWGKWYRWPSYIYLSLFKSPNGTCCCTDGSNDYYWNGWFKSPKGCDCGG